MRASLAIILAAYLSHCASMSRKTSEDAAASATQMCSKIGYEELSRPYDLGLDYPIDCIQITRIKSGDDNAIQISLTGSRATVWPKFFFVWSGRVPPSVGIAYPKSPEGNSFPGYYGISTSTIKAPSEEKSAPDYPDIKMTFTAIAEESNQPTAGTLTLTSAGASKTIDFKVLTKVTLK